MTGAASTCSQHWSGDLITAPGTGSRLSPAAHWAKKAASMQRDLAITFAGGGNRAFFQLGLMNRLAPLLAPRLSAIAACSAGACVATMWLADRAVETHAYWIKRREGVTRNLDVRRVFGREPLAPHGAVYRDTLHFSFREGGFEKVVAQPFPIWILAARFPAMWPSSLAVAAGLGAYSLEKAMRREMIHPSWGKKLGFRPFIFDARDCRTPEELADLVLASSASPPFTPVGRFAGEALLDGGMVDNVPAFVAERDPAVKLNVVLLTRPYPTRVLGRSGARYYIAPSSPVPIERWDYTRPERLAATIDMGEREAQLHQPALLGLVGG
jgi:predicted acylesterase/phospholipase RssA